MYSAHASRLQESILEVHRTGRYRLRNSLSIPTDKGSIQIDNDHTRSEVFLSMRALGTESLLRVASGEIRRLGRNSRLRKS